MPGWFIHLDVAREVAQRLGEAPDTNESPTNAELARIIARFPNYYALGAIGPDLFFFLPDFKGQVGNMVARLAEWVIKLWDNLDENVIGPWEDKMGPISEDNNELVSRLTGGLSEEISNLTNIASGIFTEALLDFASRLYDWFGLLGSGPGPAYDDKLFFWSDMFHYRRTNEFACDLFNRAVNNGYTDQDGRVDPDAESSFGYEQGIAYALGWMTHIGTDVTGHCFVNEKAGGPYRLHWQRHHLVENHMDAFSYDFRHGKDGVYPLLATSALHFWMQFRDDEEHTPQYNFLLGVSNDAFPDPPDPDAPTGPLPQYPTGLSSREYFQRRKIFDVDAQIPPALASFLLDTMKDTFYDRHSPGNNDDMATHPMILAAITRSADGRPDQELMHTNFELFYKYIKMASTDYWRMPKPQPPELFPNLSPPIPPGNEDAPGPDDSIWNTWDMLLAIFAWILYVVEWIGYLLTVLPAIIADLATFPARYVLYLFEEALYEIWKAFHLLLVMEGFVLPEPDEIDLGLVQLGLPSQGPYHGLLEFMNDIFGGLLGDNPNPVPLAEPVNDPAFPRDTVVDDPTLVQQFVGAVGDFVNQVLHRHPGCADLEDPVDPRVPSEFLRPWEYPLQNNDGRPVGSEPGNTRASPYVPGMLPTTLLGQQPGSDDARRAYELAQTPAATDLLNRDSLNAEFNLGDPINFSIYVIDQLTGADPAQVQSFNLDADRGYGYKCWDWDRRNGYQGENPSVIAKYGEGFLYPVPCTPPRQFDKIDLCGTSTPHNLPHLDFDPARPVQVHYLGLLQGDAETPGYPKCDTNGDVPEGESSASPGVPPTPPPIK